jgi:methyl-accepting chemotaxis protein
MESINQVGESINQIGESVDQGECRPGRVSTRESVNQVGKSINQVGKSVNQVADDPFHLIRLGFWSLIPYLFCH